MMLCGYGMWLKLCDMGEKWRMWRVIKKMYEASRSTVLLEGEKLTMFSAVQGVAQGCSLSPIVFTKDVEQAEIGILVRGLEGCGLLTSL